METILYCHKWKGIFISFFGHPSLVKMCGAKDDDILKVKVKEYKGKNPEYWAWWNNKEKEFQNVWPSKGQVEMCFPYGTKLPVERGEGKICTVEIEILPT